MATVEQIRNGTKIRSFYTRNEDKLEAGVMLRDFLRRNMFQPNDELTLDGLFDMGKSEEGSLCFPTGTYDKPVVVRASENAVVQPILLSQIHSDDHGSAFTGWYNVFKGISLEEKTWNTQEDGRCFGFDLRKHNGDGDWLRPKESVDMSRGPIVRFYDCKLSATCWTMFSWFDFPVYAEAMRCSISSYRLGWAMCGSGGHIQRSVLQGCDINVDTSQWNDYGATAGNWGGGLGAVYRNGVHSIVNCSFNSVWGPVKTGAAKWGAPRLVGVTTYFGEPGSPESACGPQTDTKITIRNTKFTAKPTTAERYLCWDLDIRHPNILRSLTLEGNEGTGEYRSLRIR